MATTKEKKDWFEKQELVLPQQIHDIGKVLKMDIRFQTVEEKENGHSMLLCDLTDCKLYAAGREINLDEEDDCSDNDSVPSHIASDD